jgi:hypothetical protein
VPGVDRPADAGVDPPGGGEPLVHRRPGRERVFVAHGLPGQHRVEAGEAAVPAGSGQRRLVAVGEGLGEHQDASRVVGLELEAERAAALPAADQQVGRVAVADGELAGEPAPQLVGCGQGAPDPFDGLVVAPFEAQRGAVLQGEPAKAQLGRDEGPARGGVETEAGRVALVPLPDRLVSARF